MSGFCIGVLVTGIGWCLALLYLSRPGGPVVAVERWWIENPERWEGLRRQLVKEGKPK